jgi:hypothetical protein
LFSKKTALLVKLSYAKHGRSCAIVHHLICWACTKNFNLLSLHVCECFSEGKKIFLQCF